MEYGVQIVSLAVIVSILVCYFQSSRMPLMSTKLFSLFVCTAFINILAEFFALYTLTHMNKTGMGLSRFAHQLFIGSLDCLIFFLFLYVDIKTRTQERYSKVQYIKRVLPVTVSMIMVLFGNIQYHVDSDGIYSYGPMAMTVYISVICYTIGIVRCLAKKNNNFSGKSKISIYCGVLVWAGTAIFQFFNPEKLLSSLAVALMAQFVYISLENPREYFEHELRNTKNRHAFELMLAETTERGVPFYVVSVAVTDTGALKEVFGYKSIVMILQKVSEYMERLTGTGTFRSGENAISVIIEGKEGYTKFLNNSPVCIEYKDDEGAVIDFSYFVSILEGKKYVASAEETAGIVNFVNSEGSRYAKDGMLYVNEEIIRQKDYMLAVEQLVHKAVNEDGFEVYYQPIYSTENKNFVSAEALVRLKDTQTLGYISPEIFVPVAERSGMIGELGNIVFDKVCRFVAANKLWEYGIEYIEVNISGIQGVDENLPATLAACMRKYGVKPSFINLEITETAAVEEGKRLEKNMTKLRTMGCRFSMDDFGTGYSNFSKVADTKFELIKLDKSLLWPCFGNDNANAMVILNTCIDMIKRLGISIVAEGVENIEQAELLMSKGVDYLQGYYYSKPVPGEQYIEFVKAAH